MIDHIHSFTIPAAYTLLPTPMQSPAATAMLLAIGLQETQFLKRQQLAGGPARSFWQFEVPGVVQVLNDRHTLSVIGTAAASLCYGDLRDRAAEDVLEVIRHNDTLACCFARCLLWQHPDALPERHEPEVAWRQYRIMWRPGRPRRATWDSYYEEAWARVTMTAPSS